MKFGHRKSLEIAREAVRLHSSGLTWGIVCLHLRVKLPWIKYWKKRLAPGDKVS